jgi:predicted transposase YbfD/YdcC
MDYSMFPLQAQETPVLDTQGLSSLYQTFQRLADPRHVRGRRYDLAFVLTALLLAKLMGETTLCGAVHWLRLRSTWLQEQFGLKRSSMPCQMTFCNVLNALDAQQVNDLLAEFFGRWEAQSRCGNEPSRLVNQEGKRVHAHVAIDGKTMRATTKTDQKTHLVSWYEVQSGRVLAQQAVAEKENEISAVSQMLCASLVQGRILSADAMHTQRAFCAQVKRLGGDYLLIAKDNQAQTREDIADLFEDRTPDRRRWRTACTHEKGHGRQEWRHITCSPDLNDWFAKQWSGIEQVFQVRRERLSSKTGKKSYEVVYGFTSLSAHQASPDALLSLLRDHWAIENRLHWRRDVTLGEDRCQCRTGKVPVLLSLFNTAVLSIMDRLQVTNVPQQMRRFHAHPQQAINLLLAADFRGL